jgi:hypothetical protein
MPRFGATGRELWQLYWVILCQLQCKRIGQEWNGRAGIASGAFLSSSLGDGRDWIKAVTVGGSSDSEPDVRMLRLENIDNANKYRMPTERVFESSVKPKIVSRALLARPRCASEPSRVSGRLISGRWW